MPAPTAPRALTAAAYGGYPETARVLVDAGANVNSKDSSGRTPLMAAALSGSSDVARLLLDHKADLNAEDSGGSTALIYAAANGHFEFIDLLAGAGLTKGADMGLAFAVRGCHMPTVRRLLDSGAKTTAAIDGTPVIVLAAAGNCREAIELLLAKGADVNAADEEGETALMQAATSGFTAVAQLLLDRGANLDQPSKKNQTAWLMAAMGDQRDVVEIFKAYREKHPSPQPK